MTERPFCITSLDSAHERTGFHCGSPPLDNYIKCQVMQDIRKRMTAYFVALTSDGRIAGYYTLASASVLLSDIPSVVGKKLPRYPSVPVVRMGLFAVDRDFQGQGLSGVLLADAMSRVYDSEIVAYALIVNAKNESAAAFYLHHGFIALPNTPMTLFLPISMLELASVL